MTGTRNIEIVERALEKAGLVARQGSKNAQAGRFDDLDELKVVARKILVDATGAAAAWAQWEAINDECSKPRVANAGLAFNALPTVRLALARDALLTCYRLSDVSKDDRRTLTRLAKALRHPEIAQRLASPEWALDQGHKPLVVDGSAKRNLERMQRISAMVVPDWNDTSTKPSDPKLLDLRKKLKPIRDRVLAHAIEGVELEHLTVDEIRQLVEITFDLAHEASLLFSGSAPTKSMTLELLRDQASKFWAAAFEGILARLEDH